MTLPSAKVCLILIFNRSHLILVFISRLSFFATLQSAQASRCSYSFRMRATACLISNSALSSSGNINLGIDAELAQALANGPAQRATGSAVAETYSASCRPTNDYRPHTSG